MSALRISWYLIESSLPSTSEMFPVLLAEKQAQSVIIHPRAQQLDKFSFHDTLHPFFSKHKFNHRGQKILFYLRQSTGHVSKIHRACSNLTLETSDAEETGKVFF